MAVYQSNENPLERIFNIGLMFACDTSFKSLTMTSDILSQSPTFKQIQSLATNFQKQLEKTISEIKLPDRFSAKEIVNEIIHHSNSNLFSKRDKKEKTPIKLTVEDQELLKYTFFIRKFQSRANLIFENNEELTTLIPMFETLQSLVQKTYTEFLSSIKKEQLRVDHQFLSSDFPADYVRIMNNSLNVLKTYILYYLTSFPDLGKLFSDVFWEKTSQESLEEQYLFFAMQPLFNQYQFKLICDYFKIELYINTWHAQHIKDIFNAPKKGLSVTNLDKNYFHKLLNSFEQLSEEFHELLIDVAKNEQKDLSFTLELENKDNSENLKFLTNILSPY